MQGMLVSGVFIQNSLEFSSDLGVLEPQRKGEFGMEKKKNKGINMIKW